MSLKLSDPLNQAEADRIEAEFARAIAAIGPCDDAAVMQAAIQLATRASERMGGNERAMLASLLFLACNCDARLTMMTAGEHIIGMVRASGRRTPAQKGSTS